MSAIVVRGARTHNLKNVSLEIPRDRLVVLTGLSGSGKSSLAFDTIYAEGQRRYVESLSAYARQFLEQMGKPDVDSIDGLSPAISIEQQAGARNPRSTVGTVTEIHDYLRLAFARVGVVHCWQCGDRIAAQTVGQMADRVLALADGTRLAVLAPVVRERKGEYRKELEEWRAQGFVRATIDGEVRELSEDIKLDRNRLHTVDVHVDRILLRGDRDGLRPRVVDSLELALRLAGGLARVLVTGGEEMLFSERFACPRCGVSFPEMTPRMFSFNSPQGACPDCDGLGARLYFDPERVVPDGTLSLREGAVEPWERNRAFYQAMLEGLAEDKGFDLATPWAELSEEVRQIVLRGTGEAPTTVGKGKRGAKRGKAAPFEGVIANLERRLREHQARRREAGGPEDFEALYDEFQRYMSSTPCESCGGARLRREARFVRLGGRAIDELSAMPINALGRFFAELRLGPREEQIADRVLREIRDRLGFLVDVGLDYLTLARQAATLSGGEAQRIRLATQIGSSLVGVLYVLDEPSIGLHPRDNGRLLATLRRLRDQGNSVLVVEHDEETIRSADHVVDLGPRAGAAGGEVVAQGTPAEVAASPTSLTGAYLSGRLRIDVPPRRPPPTEWLTVRGARAHNLKRIDARFPLGRLCCVTGVSGSGKSSLVIDTLHAALAARLHRVRSAPCECDGIDGLERVDKVVNIDQSPIGRTPRSNPATYTGVFSLVRDLFAALPEARARGYRPGRFSFNVKGGRCESCQGDGILRVEMHFLPDVYVRCEACEGRRYNRETLEVRYKGASIADVLAMTVAEASEHLGNVPRLRTRLDMLREVGLGYITLGQPATTLSGGEAQRIKASLELARRATGRTVYILDEPTTGLHFDDIRQLLAVLNRLVDQGNTVIVIEHHLDVIKTADWIIDLGPEGGDGGGSIVAEGTPDEVAHAPGSLTGGFLGRAL